MIKYAIPLAVVALVGCSSTSDYQKYSETQVAIARYKAEADKAKYQVLAEVVKKGDPAASVAAVMSMQMGFSGGGQEQKIDAPRSSGDDAFKWASLLLPTVVQGFGIYENAKVATTQSNNATATAINTNGTFASIANTGSNNQASMAANSNAGIVSVANGATTSLATLANSANQTTATALTNMAATNAGNVTTALTNQSAAYNSVLSMDLATMNNAVSKLTTAPVVITNGVIQH